MGSYCQPCDECRSYWDAVSGSCAHCDDHTQSLAFNLSVHHAVHYGSTSLAHELLLRVADGFSEFTDTMAPKEVSWWSDRLELYARSNWDTDDGIQLSHASGFALGDTRFDARSQLAGALAIGLRDARWLMSP